MAQKQMQRFLGVVDSMNNLFSHTSWRHSHHCSQTSQRLGEAKVWPHLCSWSSRPADTVASEPQSLLLLLSGWQNEGSTECPAWQWLQSDASEIVATLSSLGIALSAA